MSKQAEKGAGGLESDLLEKERENIRLKAELEESRASNKRLSTQNSKLKQKGGDTESVPAEAGGIQTPQSESSVTEHPPKKNSVTEQPVLDEGSVHFIKPYDKFCTTCGDKNLDFKPEVACDGCNKVLGSIEQVIGNRPGTTIPKVASCPDCGVKTAHKIEVKRA